MFPYIENDDLVIEYLLELDKLAYGSNDRIKQAIDDYLNFKRQYWEKYELLQQANQTITDLTNLLYGEVSEEG